MKFIAVATLFTLASAHDLHGRHAGAARLLAKRQATSTSATSSVSATSAASGTTAASKSTTTSAAVPAVQTTPIGAGTDIPPLSSILSGAAPEATASVTTVYPAGATPPISGAPALPSCMWLLFTSAIFSLYNDLIFIAVVFSAADWPASDKLPDTSMFSRLFLWFISDQIPGSLLSGPGVAEGVGWFRHPRLEPNR